MLVFELTVYIIKVLQALRSRVAAVLFRAINLSGNTTAIFCHSNSLYSKLNAITLSPTLEINLYSGLLYAYQLAINN